VKHTRDSIHILKRIGYPTKLSPEPYSTQWHVLQESGNPIVYIQVSHDDVNPEWIWSSVLENINRFRAFLKGSTAG
jgi:hypothetical protein